MQDPGWGDQGAESSVGFSLPGMGLGGWAGAASAMLLMMKENHYSLLRVMWELSDTEMQIAQQFGREVCDVQWS